MGVGISGLLLHSKIDCILAEAKIQRLGESPHSSPLLKSKPGSCPGPQAQKNSIKGSKDLGWIIAACSHNISLYIIPLWKHKAVLQKSKKGRKKQYEPKLKKEELVEGIILSLIIKQGKRKQAKKNRKSLSCRLNCCYFNNFM